MKRIAVRAVIKRGNKYMLFRRAERKGHGQWQFVGGKTDGQAPTLALKREVKEESGLHVMNIRKLGEHFNPVNKSIEKFYSVNAKGRVKLQKEEVNRYGFFTKSQAKKMPLTYSTRKFLGRRIQ